MKQVKITNLRGKQETVRVPEPPCWAGRFDIGLGHTLLTMSEQNTRACRCFIQIERSAKDQEWKEVDRPNYEEYVDWITRDYAAGLYPIPYRRPKVPYWKKRELRRDLLLLCLVFLTSCTPYHHSPTPKPVDIYGMSPAHYQEWLAERAQQDARLKSGPMLGIGLVYLYNPPKTVRPSEFYAPFEPHIPTLKTAQSWDSCSIYGVDQSEWDRLSTTDRATTPYRSAYRGYNDRNQQFRMGAKSFTGLSVLPHLEELPRSPMNWEDQYQYEVDGGLGVGNLDGL